MRCLIGTTCFDCQWAQLVLVAYLCGTHVCALTCAEHMYVRCGEWFEDFAMDPYVYRGPAGAHGAVVLLCVGTPTFR